MKAVGCYIFAGGFTLGVKKHFDVEAVLEGDDYGVSTMRHNQPEIPVHVGKAAWPLDILKGLYPEFVYCNPPCAVWSSAGSSAVRATDWRLDPRVQCWKDSAELLEKLQPKVLAVESVPNAMTRGRELIDELAAYAMGLGYSVTYLFEDAKWLGVPQQRRRFMFVASRVRFDVEEMAWPEPITLGGALRRVNDPFRDDDLPTKSALRDEHIHLVPGLPEGGRLRKVWETRNPESTWRRNSAGGVVGRPIFTFHRARSDRPSGVMSGCEVIHPTEDRLITVREWCELCGYPPDYRFVARSHKEACHLIARGVLPPVGEWLARNVRRCIERDEADPEPVLQLIDVSEPPGLVQRPLQAGAPVQAPQKAPPVERAPRQAAGSASPLPIPVAPVRGPRIRPKEGVGSGAFMRWLLMTGEWTSAGILRLVHENYPASVATMSDVSYNRNRLKKDGQAIPPYGRYS